MCAQQTALKDIVQRLQDNVLLSDVIQTSVQLKKKGHEYSGCCPFHNEKTPSFTVNNEKGFYHCFGCGAHGDAIHFLQENNKLSFKEALEKLSDLSGINLPNNLFSSESTEKFEKREKSKSLLKVVCQWYQKNLKMPHGKKAYNYLKNRGLTDETIESFALGYSPPREQNTLFNDLIKQGFTDQDFLKSGLISQNTPRRNYYDRFSGRIIFPIFDAQNNVIAFGGRIMGEGQPKYLNSSESDIFKKKETLFNLNKARFDKTNPFMIVVEGYMDVISLAQKGFHKTVAPLGTAFSDQQLKLLWRYDQKPVICLDGDASGMRAAQKIAENSLAHIHRSYSLRFCILPSGDDPDSYIRSRGEEAFKTLLEKNIDLASFMWNSISKGIDFSKPDECIELQNTTSELTKTITDSIAKQQYSFYFKNKISTEIWRNKNKHSDQKINTPRIKSVHDTNLLQYRQEQTILTTFIHHPDLFDFFENELILINFRDNEFEKIWLHLLEIISQEGLENINLKNHLYPEELEKLFSSDAESNIYMLAPFASPNSNIEEAKKGIKNILGFLQKNQLSKEEKQLEQSLIENMTDENYQRLLKLKEEKIRIEEGFSN